MYIALRRGLGVKARHLALEEAPMGRFLIRRAKRREKKSVQRAS